MDSSTHSTSIDYSPMIYLVENDPSQIEILSTLLKANNYQIKLFTDIDTFRSTCSATEKACPDAVIICMEIHPENDDFTSLEADLRRCKNENIPVIVTSKHDELPARLAALRAGASRFLTKSIDTESLINLLDELTGRRPASPFRVLLVDDDVVLLELYAIILSNAGMIVQTISEPMKTLDVVKSFSPDIVILDINMPEVSGHELAAILRERDCQLPILFLSAIPDLKQQVLGLELGGDDFLVKPVEKERLLAVITARARRARLNKGIRQRLENTLSEREQEHLALNHHAIVSITDRNGNITYVNDRFCKISGYSSDELLGRNHNIVRSDEHSTEFYQDLWQTISTGNVWQGEICNRCKDGSLYWVESTITPFLDDSGKPYQYVSMRTDISHVKLAETALRKSESRLNYLVTASPVTIYTCAATRIYGATYISPNVKYMMGYEPEQFTDDSEFWTDNIHPDDRARIFHDTLKLFEHGLFQGEYRFRISDGSYIWVHDEMRMTHDDTGQPVEIIGYLANVTARKNAEKSLETQKERLRRGQIFANVGTWDWNIQTGDLVWSERIGPLFG